MNLNSFKVKDISRVIAHSIIGKTQEEDAYTDNLNDLLNFDLSEKKMLIERLEESLNNSKKTFKLDYKGTSSESIYSNLKENRPFDDKAFVDFSKKLSEKLAHAHFSVGIPGGYCLLGEGTLKNGSYFFFVLKAELQKVFSITGINLKVVKDVFLSPAKDFYKVAVFINNNDDFIPFMFDDQFSMQKKDLTEYFYGRFLGLTTDKNDDIKSKNFFKDTKAFIEKNVDNIPDQIGLLNALRVLFREDTSGIISPEAFSENYLELKIKNKYDKMIKDKYPHSFTKDLSLIEEASEMKRVSMPLTYALKIVGDIDSLTNVEIINSPNESDLKRVSTEVNSGKIDKIITLQVRAD